MTLLEVVASFKTIVSNNQVHEFDMKGQLESIQSSLKCQGNHCEFELVKKKVFINYDNIDDLITSMREAILTNLLMNPYFKSHLTPKYVYVNFFKLFESTEINENLKARLALALHLSKGDISSMDTFSKYLSRCLSLEILDITNEKLYEVVYKHINSDFFRDILNNTQVYHALRETMTKVTHRSSFKMDMDMNLKFFVCLIDGLTGFPDIDTIYVNVNRYVYMYYDMINTKKVSEDEALMILRLDFIRLIVHEAAHMLIRKDAQDLNVSTPKLLKDSNLLVGESGIMAEMELFGLKIDFLKTVQSSNFDLNYIKKMYENIVIKQEPIEKDPSKLVALDPLWFPKMAVDLNNNYREFIFEF